MVRSVGLIFFLIAFDVSLLVVTVDLALVIIFPSDYCIVTSSPGSLLGSSTSSSVSSGALKIYSYCRDGIEELRICYVFRTRA